MSTLLPVILPNTTVSGNISTTGNIALTANTYVATTTNLQSVNASDVVSLYTNTTGNINVGNTSGNVVVAGNVFTTLNINSNNLAKSWNAGLLGISAYLSGVNYLLLGTLGDWNALSSYGNINIKGILGGWVDSTMVYIDCSIHTRQASGSTPQICGYCRSTNYTASSVNPADIAIYYTGTTGASTGAQYYVYLVLSPTIVSTLFFVSFDIQVSGHTNDAKSVYLYNPNSNLSTTTPTGTLVLTSLITYLSSVVQMNGANVASTSTTTGSLVVGGGMGVSGNVNIGGNIASNGFKLSTVGTNYSINGNGGVLYYYKQITMSTTGPPYTGTILTATLPSSYGGIFIELIIGGTFNQVGLSVIKYEFAIGNNTTSNTVYQNGNTIASGSGIPSSILVVNNNPAYPVTVLQTTSGLVTTITYSETGGNGTLSAHIRCISLGASATIV